MGIAENNTLDNFSNSFNPFDGPEIVKIIPIIEPQLEIWTSCQMGGNDANRAFNESVSIKFDGVFNKVAFELALSALVERHESLRSVFTVDGSKMIVFKTIPLNYEFKDVTSLSSHDQSKAIDAIKLNDVLISFDLVNGPLFKFSLLKISETHYFFTITAHHIICDGWSIGLLIQDISKLYSGYVQNIEPILPRAGSFSDYAIEQIKFSQSSEYKKNENFWLGQFSKNIPVLNIPTDYERPNPRTYKSSRIDFSIDTELINALKIVGVKEGFSLVNTLLASFELFLHAYTGQDDIIIGLPTAGQLVSGYYDLVGHCVSLLPIRSYPNSQLNFCEYLKARKSSILDAYEHQRLTFGSLIKKLNLPRQASRIPLVPVVFNMDTDMENETNFYQLNFDIYSNPREYENFELYLNVWNTKKGIQLEWSYNSQLFERSTIEKMMADFELLLRSIVANPTQKLEQLLRHYSIQSTLQSKEIAVDILQLEQSRNYYLKLFSGELSVIDFPFDNSRTISNTFSLGELHHIIPSITYSELVKFQGAQRTSFSYIILGLVEVLLYKYTGETDLILGFKDPKNKTIALRQALNSGSNFIELLIQNKEQLEQGLSNKNYTLSNLLRDLSLSKHSSRNGLFDIKISIEDSAESNTTDYLEETIGVQDLHFKFNINSDGLSVDLLYNNSLLNNLTAERLLNHLDSLLKELLVKSTEPIKSIDYISEKERQEILSTFNDTAIPYPQDENVTSLFEKQVAQTPSNIALVFENNSYNYENLNAIANQLGHFLRQKYSIQSDDLIGIKLNRSHWLIISILGVLKSGGAYLPIDPEYPQERIDYLTNNSQCKVVIDSTLLQEFQNTMSNYSVSNLSSINKVSDLVYVMYTSGSSGQPKGVMVEHRNVVRLVKSANYIDLKGRHVLLSTGAISFDATTFEYWSMLLNGGTLILCEQNKLLDYKLLSQEIKKHKVEIMWFTAGWLNQLVDADIHLFQGLKILLAGGDKLSSVHINKLIKEYPNLKIINGYGPTENTTFSLTYSIDNAIDNIPIGRPISNSRAYILDIDNHLAPIGVNGEIVLGGAGIARGYLNQPQLTNEKFVVDNLIESGKLYNSGDIGRWLPDGNIQFIGRKDFQIKLRGYRIELGEIESVLSNYPDIINSVVKVIEGEQKDGYLAAYFVSQNEISNEAIKAYVKSKLPTYMVPTYFIKMNELPLNKNGKVEIQKLPNPNLYRESNNLALNNPIEAHLLRIWSDILGLKNISKFDNFFELGGHSLIVIRLILKLESELGLKLPMSSLFKYPTIEKLAEFINSETSDSKWKCLVPIQPTGNKLPVYLVHGAGLGVLIFSNIVKHLDKDQPVYGLQPLGIDGIDEPLDSIEEMAAYYISEILQQNANGPYAIAGLSSGGLIAYEMAQQLKKMGKVVNVLAVFDFDLYEIEKYNNNDYLSKIKRMFNNMLPSLLFFFISVFKYPKKTYEYYLMCWNLRFVSFKRRLGYKEIEILDSVHNDLQKAMEKNEIAFKKYKLMPYENGLDLFIAKKKVYYQKDSKYMGWQEFVKGGITIHAVEGDHDDMILPPNNKNFAYVLQQILDSKNKV